MSASAERYLHTHGVEGALAGAIARALRERPQDPLGAIAGWLLSSSSSSRDGQSLPPCVTTPATTTVGALLAEAEGGTLGTRLAALGLEASRASSFASAARRLLAAGVDPGARANAFWVPGRIEVLGKHTDYAGGRSLLCAVNRGFSVVSAERADAVCRVLASFELTGTTDEAAIALSASPDAARPDGWAMYPAVTAARLARNFGLAGGVDLALACDLPEASGMSSSSAVIIATFLSLSARNRLADNPNFRSWLPTAEELCHYLGCIENGQDCGAHLPGDAGVGTFGGSEDHTAILLCRRAELRQYSFCPTHLEGSLALPRTLAFVIAVSGATARKGAERLSDYNNAATLAKLAAAAATTDDAAAAAHSPPPTLAAVTAATARRLGLRASDEAVARDVAACIARSDDGTHPSGLPPGVLCRRYEQFHAESEVIIPAVFEALERVGRREGGRADEPSLEDLSALVDRSQSLTASHLRNTLEETEWLPAAARRLGAIAASAFGAGFGGSVWALVRADEAEDLLARWQREYAQAYPERQIDARFFTMASPAPGACSVVG